MASSRVYLLVADSHRRPAADQAIQDQPVVGRTPPLHEILRSKQIPE